MPELNGERESGDDYAGPDRRRPQPIQRDWFGHLLMFLGTAAIIVVAVFGGWVTINSSVAALQTKIDDLSKQVAMIESTQGNTGILTTRVDRDERDIADLRGSFVATATTLTTISNQLAVFDERIKDWLPPKGRR